jgi:CxxC-x17-CxxC domain-containing protein
LANFITRGSDVSYVDKTLTCRDCGQTFVFTEGEQEFYAQKGFQNEPGRCPECRSARKSQRGGYAYDTERGGGYTRGPRQMFEATCSRCGGVAQVPFQPRTDKPVYCSACFEQQRSYR